MNTRDQPTPPKSMLYTRSGDTGETSLFGGGRVPKDHPRVEAYGTIDELNSAIGVAIAFLTGPHSSASQGPSPGETPPSAGQAPSPGEGLPHVGQGPSPDLHAELTAIQNELFNIGAELASETAGDKAAAFAAAFIEADAKIAGLESLTDTLDAALPPLETFILPSGSRAGALLHLCRTICRRAEREVVRLSHTEPVNPDITRYLNRLSDLLFALARYINHAQGHPETPWRKG